MVKNLLANAGHTSLILGLGKLPGGRNGNPFQYSSGKSHGQRSLAGYSAWGYQESDTTKWLSIYIKYKIFQILLVNVRYLNFCIKDLVILNSVDVIIWQLAELNAISNIYLFFNWRVIALQNFAVFCQTSTWISHVYTYIPSPLNLPPISHPVPSL